MLDSYTAKNYEYNGVKMTEYEASQKQREIERNIRRWKCEESAMCAAGLPTDDAKSRVKWWKDQESSFLKQTGLKRQAGREIISGNVDSVIKRDIIKLSKTAEDFISKKDFKELSGYVGKISDVAARKWYKYHDSLIPGLIDKSLPLEEQAKQAWSLRNQNRTNARDLMRDQEKRRILDKTEPNKSFEDLIEDKISRKGITRDEALKDIIETSTKTRKKIDTSLGLE